MLAAETTLQNRYRIKGLLGQGGMGAVYQAIDRRLDTIVALKECFFSEELMRKQFEREARLLARLRHPAITKVIDHFSEGGGQFLVMEFIQGVDLLELLKDRGTPFAPNEVLKWGDQLLDALDYLHSQEPQIIHRDIKPQNLKLLATGQIILLDFGLAKSFGAQMSQVTSSGSILGYTPSYAPLEQIQGTGTDNRSDLYSLAATLYHLMTGVTPPSALSRATAVLNNEPDPLRPANEMNPGVTPSVGAVLMQAMFIDRDRRPRSAGLMRKALHEAAESLPPNVGGLAAWPASSVADPAATNPQQNVRTAVMSSPPFRQSQSAEPSSQISEPTIVRGSPGKSAPAIRKSKAPIWIAASLITLAAVIVLVVLIAKQNSATSGASRETPNPARQPQVPESAESNTIGGLRRTLAVTSKDVNSVAFSPDGRLMACGNGDGTVNLWDTATQELKKTLEEPDSEVVSVAFAPDGSLLAIARVGTGGSGSVSFVDPKTGEAKQKLVEDNINAIAFSPDGKTLAVANISSSLKLWDVSSGSVKQILAGQDIQTRSVDFSPDGRVVVGGGYGNTVKVWDSLTGTLKLTLTGHDGEIGAVAFSPDGKTIASGSSDDTVKLWDPETGALRHTLSGADFAVTALSFSSDGKIVAGVVGRSVWLWDAQDGSFRRKLTGHEALIHSVAISPDGKTLASGAADATVKLWNMGI